MYILQKVAPVMRIRGHRMLAAAAIGIVWLSFTCVPAVAADAAK